MRRKRHRVVLRPKLRRRRFQQAGAAAAVAVLGGLAVVTAGHIRKELPSRESLTAWADGRLAAKVEGAPAGYEEKISAVLGERSLGGIDARAEKLKEEFPFIESVATRHLWLAKTVVYQLTLRQPVGQVKRAKGPRYLSSSGELFEAPPALYPGTLPVLEPGSAQPEELKSLAQCLMILRTKTLPAPLESMRFVSAQEGWRVTFSDGTTVLWGNLNWTGEKVSRLREVLADGREHFPKGPLTADLRYFDDGRILLRQVK